jgi:hypothetical protein
VETDQQKVIAFKTAGQTVVQIFRNGAAQVVALSFMRSASVSLPSTTRGPGCFSLISRHLADNGAQRAAHLKFVRRFGVHRAVFGNHFQQRLLNVFRHTIGVAADINMGAVINPAPQFGPCSRSLS